ncbi:MULTISPECIES: hypothetical protein [Paenibacillus]|jgi:hypothetical protein|uniref:Uncharacterized protein n=1 Tax=Paenibacillus azoreducens TaxID=116718 RepID=A0A919YE95_9BACL|nr:MULTISPECIES: hypothetical protein [Paenibacillus]GIO50061.1 hypothetical protein J34TS1_48260 [Paenibacillus azoreducens]
MPYHRPLKINNQQNKASNKEETITQRPEKAAKVPPSLNGISKQE